MIPLSIIDLSQRVLSPVADQPEMSKVSSWFVNVWAIAIKMFRSVDQDLMMIHPRTILDFATAEPFLPFQIHMASGVTFEVRHPEINRVGRSFATVPMSPDGGDEQPSRWQELCSTRSFLTGFTLFSCAGENLSLVTVQGRSLMLMESLAHVTNVGQAGS